MNRIPAMFNRTEHLQFNQRSTIKMADMEKGLDTPTLSAEIYENCGNFFIIED